MLGLRSGRIARYVLPDTSVLKAAVTAEMHRSDADSAVCLVSITVPLPALHVNPLGPGPGPWHSLVGTGRHAQPQYGVGAQRRVYDDCEQREDKIWDGGFCKVSSIEMHVELAGE